MKTDVLFIHRQLAFAVSIKQALERTGNYSVHPFTSVEAALEYLGGHTQDVALIDFMMPVYSGEEIVTRVRQAQPQLTIVATPTQTEEEFTRLNLQGMLPAAFTAIEFIPVIERALEGRRTGELPPSSPRAGLLDRVQGDGGPAGEKRPPTSVIGYRSLESILNEGSASRQAETAPAEDAPTLVQGLPAVQADDLSFLNDVLPPRVEPDAETDLRLRTDRLPDMDKFQSDEFPTVAPQPEKIRTDPLDGMTRPLGDDEIEEFLQQQEPDAQARLQTERLPGMDQFDPNAQPVTQPDVSSIRTDPLDGMTRPLGDDEAEEFLPPPVKGTDYLAGMTRPLPEDALEFEDLFPEELAETPPRGTRADWPVEGDHGTRPLPDMSFEEEQFTPAEPDLSALSARLRANDPLGTRPLAEEDVTGLFGSPADFTPSVPPPIDEMAEEEAPDSIIDYFAELDLHPSPPSPASPVAQEPVPSEDDVVAGLMALFPGQDEPSAVAEADPFDFDALIPGAAQEDDAFAGVLGEIATDVPAERQPTAFDDLVASMRAQQQRPPLPVRQQIVEPPTLTEDMSSLLDQIEQANAQSDLAEPEAGFDLGPVDLSAVLFEGDEEELSDTPSTPMSVVQEEAPALASAEELAALFASAPEEEEEQDWSSGILFEETPLAEPEIEELVTLEDSAEAGPEFEELFAAEEDRAEIDFEAMFGSTLPEPEAPPDFDAMFGLTPAAPEPEPEAAPPSSVFTSNWDDIAPLEVEQTPGFEETGTVSDLMTGVGEVTGGRTGMLTRLDTDLSTRNKPSHAEPETAAAPLPAIDDSVSALLAEIEQQLMSAPPAQGIARDPKEDSGDTPAKRILTTTEAELTDSSFSVNSLIRNIEAQMPPNQVKVQPLPSWLRTPPPAPLPPETPVTTAPPDLPEAPPPETTLAHTPPAPIPVFEGDLALEEEPSFDWENAGFDDTTVMGEAARLEQVIPTGEEETGWLDFIEPEGIASEEANAAEDLWAADQSEAPEVEAPAMVEAVAASEPVSEPEAAPDSLRAEHIDDPYIAQLALSLTDVSLELTADAVLLTRGHEIAAFAGRMSRDELVELRTALDDDWEAADDDARMRFLRLPESGKDVMLYSRPTVEGLTLSLVFDGSMSLRDIRQQGKRLTDALAAIPEAEPEAPVELVLEDTGSAADLPAIPRSPHAFVWLLRDANAMLARPVAQAIVNGLNSQLHERGWQVREMRASEDHIYLLADSPDELLPYLAVRELQRRSAQIAHVQNPSLSADDLWADAYLVVTPGRTLETDEIQQFIQFERMQ